eukprot:TRINITY_DN100029_c0_g1_i1.p1 TRINITY_DN100029_c0_g1~~TRINITY_DN100029_c0_g1_i1.p1  ORF type:complete len:233 (+),score=32.11 TRINITY_DN100029_c0_g1_i1:3-701(+)
MSNLALRVAIKRAEMEGLLFVAAAGNTGTNNGLKPQYPASYNSWGVISVTSIDPGGGLSWFACYGKHTVDLAAPGGEILSTVPGNDYGLMSGTSMACPYVSGVAALLWHLRPDLSVDEVRSALLGTGTPIVALSRWIRTGRLLNAEAAVRVVLDLPASDSHRANSTVVPAGRQLKEHPPLSPRLTSSNRVKAVLEEGQKGWLERTSSNVVVGLVALVLALLLAPKRRRPEGA